MRAIFRGWNSEVWFALMVAVCYMISCYAGLVYDIKCAKRGCKKEWNIRIYPLEKRPFASQSLASYQCLCWEPYIKIASHECHKLNVTRLFVQNQRSAKLIEIYYTRGCNTQNPVCLTAMHLLEWACRKTLLQINLSLYPFYPRPFGLRVLSSLASVSVCACICMCVDFCLSAQ